LDNYKKEFINILNGLSTEKTHYDVFSDWLTLLAAALYRWKNDKNTEDEYMNTARRYDREDLERHAQLLAVTFQALEAYEHDFLGDIFLSENLSNDKKSQYFTPFHISKIMAEATFLENEPPDNKIITICDPCCGSGVMLIAAALTLKERGFNYQKNALFVGTDIDARCARMAFIQLSILNIPAVINCGNTLTEEIFWRRETAGYHLADMNNRL